MSFDVLIVGAGSAGCVLAARLTENPKITVGVIEAGGPATDPDIAIPQRWPMLAGGTTTGLIARCRSRAPRAAGMIGPADA
jgi:choline dehydrogenase-like flavoprotein